MENNIEDRRDMIEKAVIDCLDEMYRKSQPSITWEEVETEAKVNPDKRIWQEHYLSSKKFEEIQDKYMDMYRIGNEWDSNISLVEEYLTKGGTKDKYIESHTDEDGHYHPGYRSYEKVEPIANQIEAILLEQLEPGSRTESLKKNIVNAVMNTIGYCKEFYCFNREEIGFRFNVSNYSPNSNIEAVREIYAGTDVVINDDVENNEWDEE